VSVLRLLREPRWARGLVLAVLIALVCCVLGRWQWHRRQERLAANAPLTQNYHAGVVDLARALPAGEEVRAGQVWTPVRVNGTYDTAATVLVRNRPRDETTGYDVLVPLVLPDGTALLVDRGWVPAGSSSERPDTVPAAPAGPVTVTARLRQWEAAKRGTVPRGQVASIAEGAVTGAVEAASPAPAPALRGGYAVLAAEDPAPASAPAKAEEPEVDEGPHLAYTVQWFGFALTALVVWVVAGRRELEARRQEEAGEPGEDGEPGEPRQDGQPGQPGAGRGAAPVPRPVPDRGPAPPADPAPRPRSRRPARSGVDEQAEDAELDGADQRF
jgi:cytochrome oxidase assembly protein ShyY1